MINPFVIKFKNKKLHIVINYVLPIFIGIILFFYHYLFYTKFGEYQNYTFYQESDKNIETLIPIIENVSNQLYKHNITLNSDVTIFFSSTDDNYMRSNFMIGHLTAARAYWMLNRIIVAPSDFANDCLTRQIDTFKLRKLSAILVHELVHIQLRNYLGIVKTFFLDKWKNEGYCEYIAENSTIDIVFAKNVFTNYTKEQEKLLIDKNDFLAHIYLYYKYRIKVDYLLSYKNVTFDTFIETEYDVDKLEAEIKAELLSGNYKFDKQ